MHRTNPEGRKREAGVDGTASGEGVYERREIRKGDMVGGEGVTVFLRRTTPRSLGMPAGHPSAFSPTPTYVLGKKTQLSSLSTAIPLLDISLRVQFSSSRTLADGQHVFAVRVGAVVVVRR